MRMYFIDYSGGSKIKNIYYNIDAVVEFGDASVKAPLLTKTIRADVSDIQTLTLTDTHGISGGNTISYTGVDVNNESNNRVNVVKIKKILYLLFR